jgi:hypothetical protein
MLGRSKDVLCNQQFKHNHMPARQRSMQTTQTQPRHVTNQPAGRLLSLRLSFYMTNHATASTSTIRCANVDLLVLVAIKPNPIRSLLCSDQTCLSSFCAQTDGLRCAQTMPRFLHQAKQCVCLEIKPNLVGAYIQKRFDVTLGLLTASSLAIRCLLALMSASIP